jgi:hypothetical protein
MGRIGRKIGRFFGKTMKKVGHVGRDTVKAVGALADTASAIDKATGGALDKYAGHTKAGIIAKGLASDKALGGVHRVATELVKGGDRFKAVANTFEA